uniref:Nanos homolog 2 n=1 Tax=Cynoglossus semilaevis TaxID=244447 RepID=A0A3P8WQA7_CYNSE
MTAMQRDVHGSLLMVPAEGDCFDVWRDYMDLSRLLQGLRVRNQVEPPSPSPTSPHPPPPPPSFFQTEYNKHSEGTSSSDNLSDHSYSASSDYCRFCKHNRESPNVYMSHRLKGMDGRVTCPILRKYTCVICGASGDYAHTRRYCPRTQRRGAKAVTSKFSF